MSDETHTVGIRVSDRTVDLVARAEVDDSGNWWRGVLIACYVKPMPQWHGDPPGVEYAEQTIWFGPWRQSKPTIQDFNYGERHAIDEVVGRLAASLTNLMGGRE